MSQWEKLRQFTQARIGIGRSGYAVPTKEQLRFQLDHARARDAVHWEWDVEALGKKLRQAKIPTLSARSSVRDRAEYLARPDLGRSLDGKSAKLLHKSLREGKRSPDVVVIVSNGLSSSAVNTHAAQLVTKLWTRLVAQGYVLAPVVLAENGRVALSDEIGALARAKLSLIVLGERPGLTSVDSLAVYLTYSPKPGNTDARRNCISNIRPPDGLDYATAVRKTLFLVREALRRGLSGVELKEETGLPPSFSGERIVKE